MYRNTYHMTRFVTLGKSRAQACSLLASPHPLRPLLRFYSCIVLVLLGEMEARRAEGGRAQPGDRPLVEQHAQFPGCSWTRLVRDRAHVVAAEAQVSGIEMADVGRRAG